MDRVPHDEGHGAGSRIEVPRVRLADEAALGPIRGWGCPGVPRDIPWAPMAVERVEGRIPVVDDLGVRAHGGGLQASMAHERRRPEEDDVDPARDGVLDGEELWRRPRLVVAEREHGAV